MLNSSLQIYQLVQKKQNSKQLIIRRMSVTISNCDQICNSPVNQSKAKMLYSFSKSSRFPNRKRILCEKFYDAKSSVSPSRTTTFGYGNKYQFSKNVPQTPPPTSYNFKTQFDFDSKKGFGFGKGRQQMEVTGPFVASKQNKNPGPGKYQLKSMLSNASYTLGARHNRDDRQKINIPGPGSYPATFTINKNGTYFLSKYHSSLVKNFNTLTQRGQKIQNRAPGPGQYDVSKQYLSPEGSYINSKMLGSKVRRFGKSLRNSLEAKNQTPGPGMYKLPSQFGHYIAKNIVKHNSSALLSPQKQNNPPVNA